MTFTEIYTEITKRIGQGYANYADRAKSAFWKAVGQLIRAGTFTQDDIRGLAKSLRNEAYLSVEFPFSIQNVQPISADHVWDAKVHLTPGAPANIHYTRMEERIAHRGNYLSPLDAGGVMNVFYHVEYPQINVQYDVTDASLASAWCYVQVNWIGIDRNYIETTTHDDEQVSPFMSQGFVDTAIEAAIRLLTTET